MQLNYQAMGSRFQINIPDAEIEFLEQLKAETLRLELLWSRFLPGSEISLINKSSGSPVLVSAETVLLIKKMIEAYRLTEGAYDPSLLPALIEIGYDKSLNSADITALSPHKKVGFETSDIQLDGPFVTVASSLSLDPGGIGKGLCADMLSKLIREHGYNNYFVNAGGDLYGEGLSPDGDPWRIGVENPFQSDEHICQITFEKAGVATSSNRKRVFAESSHLITPPEFTKSDIAVTQVTVISGSAARSEVLAKACFFKSAAKALDLIEKTKSAALIVTETNEHIKSAEWNRFEC